MELKRAICTSCGNELSVDYESKIGKCDACGNTFVVENAIKLNMVEVDKTKELHNLRKLLDHSVETDDYRSVLLYSSKIKEIIPNDYPATYYFAFASQKAHEPKSIHRFYNNFVQLFTEEEFNEVIHHMINNCDLRDRKLVEKFIEFYDSSLIPYFRSVFEKRKIQEDNYAMVPRDVFICHRSSDSQIVSRVVERLERDGNQCWISSRNLRPNDTDNYWRNIENAIELCNLFLVVSTQDAMLSKDVQYEIEIARKLNKARVEFKVDSTTPTTLFKHFFNGKKWIDAYNDFDKGLSDLNQRVYEEIVLSKSNSGKISTPSEAQKRIDPKIENLLKRVSLEYENGNREKALVYVENILDTDVTNFQAWWLKFLILNNFKNDTEFNEFINNIDHLNQTNQLLESIEYKNAKKMSQENIIFDRHVKIVQSINYESEQRKLYIKKEIITKKSFTIFKLYVAFMFLLILASILVNRFDFSVYASILLLALILITHIIYTVSTNKNYYLVKGVQRHLLLNDKKNIIALVFMVIVIILSILLTNSINHILLLAIVIYIECTIEKSDHIINIDFAYTRLVLLTPVFINFVYIFIFQTI